VRSVQRLDGAFRSVRRGLRLPQPLPRVRPDYCLRLPRACVTRKRRRLFARVARERARLSGDGDAHNQALHGAVPGALRRRRGLRPRRVHLHERPLRRTARSRDLLNRRRLPERMVVLRAVRLRKPARRSETLLPPVLAIQLPRVRRPHTGRRGLGRRRTGRLGAVPSSALLKADLSHACAAGRITAQSRSSIARLADGRPILTGQ
jgi:hypothetical protein